MNRLFICSFKSRLSVTAGPLYEIRSNLQLYSYLLSLEIRKTFPGVEASLVPTFYVTQRRNKPPSATLFCGKLVPWGAVEAAGITVADSKYQPGSRGYSMVLAQKWDEVEKMLLPSLYRRPLQSTPAQLSGDPSRRPVILLDIDGVINLRGFALQSYRSLGRYFICSKPNLRRKINGWHRSGRAEVLWLTQWDYRARADFAPCTGFDDFALAQETGVYGGGMEKKAVAEKWLKVGGGRRPVIWIDDNSFNLPNGELLSGLQNHTPLIAPFHPQLTRWKRPGPTLLVKPQSSIGLTEEHLDAIDDFLHDPHQEKPYDAGKLFSNEVQQRWWNTNSSVDSCGALTLPSQ